ncbi:uncharacterized protein MEPE_04521 [Melanopsichium pennsylvanicum]|uniref:Uncharacterized protein n=1 Tax=Melanopsichium pennsylvanicum TaxID=63383 RepID=A0AAJ4XQ26_9BASI|nr:uncharacterized protein MEPE_04521 [Melanopsichium pennsylvanicum]
MVIFTTTTPATNGASSGSYNKPPILPPETLTNILSAVELLSAMWSGTDELSLNSTDEASIRDLVDYLQLPLEKLGSPESIRLKEALPEEIVLGLKVRVQPQQGGSEERMNFTCGNDGVRVNVGLRLRGKVVGIFNRMWVSSVDAPSWLDRAGIEKMNGILNRNMVSTGETDSDDQDLVGTILNAIEEISEFLLTQQPTTITTTNNNNNNNNNIDTVNTTNHTNPNHSINEKSSSSSTKWVRRTWFYLPSLSTPSKRKDICQLASTWSPTLTGFLLAGKPGLIVIEYPLTLPPSFSPSSITDTETDCCSYLLEEQTALAIRAMDSFWSEIKTTSWSDIPSNHKKISEKLVQPCTTMAFTDFSDITDDPNIQRGSDRGRNTDLSKLIKWLDSKRVNAKWCLERCLGVGSWDI